MYGKFLKLSLLHISNQLVINTLYKKYQKLYAVHSSKLFILEDQFINLF
jgi:hypothetical protein